jgi:hypothetical protein
MKVSIYLNIKYLYAYFYEIALATNWSWKLTRNNQLCSDYIAKFQIHICLFLLFSECW